MLIDIGEYCIRSFSKQDVDTIVYHANNPRVAAHLRDRFPHPYTTTDAIEWIRIARNQQPESNFAIAMTQGAIGGIGLEFMDDVSFQTAGLGYWLGEEFWGKGIATAAVTAFTRYAFETYDLTRVFATVFETNPASAHVLEKAGYHFEGRLQKSVNKSGKILDQLMYATIK